MTKPEYWHREVHIGNIGKEFPEENEGALREVATAYFEFARPHMAT
jgi:hypothetical protein